MDIRTYTKIKWTRQKKNIFLPSPPQKRKEAKNKLPIVESQNGKFEFQIVRNKRKRNVIWIWSTCKVLNFNFHPQNSSTKNHHHHHLLRNSIFVFFVRWRISNLIIERYIFRFVNLIKKKFFWGERKEKYLISRIFFFCFKHT